jgi:flagellin-like hook-associated protein FlgL
VDGQNFVKDLISSWELLNNDTGSISGSDIQDGADSLDAFDVIPDAFGPPSASFIEEENDDFDPINVGGGVTFQLNTISSLSFGDSEVFNLTNTNGVELVIGRVDELIQKTSENMALVGSNINQIESFSNILSVRQTGFASNLDNINGVSYSEEMEALSYSKILINSNLSMRAQAMDIQRSATLSLLAA